MLTDPALCVCVCVCGLNRYALVKGLAAKQEDRTEEVRGPPAKIAFDEEGAPTKAV